MAAKEKRQMQNMDNGVVKEYYERLCVLPGDVTKVKRLYTCKAEMLFCDNVVLLRSYYTIVAAFDIDESTVYDFSRYVYGYTSTTAQHVRKFAIYMKALQTITYKEVR